MIQIQLFRKERNKIIDALKKRNFKEFKLIDEIILIDKKKRDILKKLDEELSEQKKIANKVADLYKQGENKKATLLREKNTSLKESSKKLKEELNSLDIKINELLCQIPNIPNDAVPSGKSEKDNEIVFKKKKNIFLPENALPHWELAKKYSLIDFERGAKVTGSGFPFYIGKCAALQRALITFFLEEAIKEGYKELLVPFVVNENSAFGTGQLPDKEGQMYLVTGDNLYLIPTAEVPITNFHRNEILKEDDLPLKYVGYSPCFRREAGSYGKDVRGLNRLHQFEKVEIVIISKPENSYDCLNEMVEYVKGILEKLELPYRVVKLCGADLGFTSALTYDLEVFSAAQKRWLEVSSISNFETFQSNRLKIRYKDKNGKIQLVHTLNGSALALPRIMASLLENNQKENKILVPTILHKYTGFEYID